VEGLAECGSSSAPVHEPWTRGQVKHNRRPEGGGPGQAQKPNEAKVALASLEATEKALPGPKKCRFPGVLGCLGTHLPWICKAFSDKAPEEKE
jgi:hypothetical protein